MALKLFAHNVKAYQAVVAMMQKYGKAAIVHPTGTGKSYVVFKLIEGNPAVPILWLSPSEHIFKTQKERSLHQNPDFDLEDVHFYTYAKLICCTQEQRQEIADLRPAYIILDEFHRVGAEYWGDSTKKPLALCPKAKLLGLTATNVRYLDNNRDKVAELFDGRIASEMPLGAAIVRGILPEPKYVTTVFKYQQDLARHQSRADNLCSPDIQDVNRKYLDELKHALEQADGLDKVFARHITNKAGKYIVFCSGREHMEKMIAYVSEWLAAVDAKPTIYRVLSEDPSTDKVFAAFKKDDSDHLKLLFCIDMLNGGVHVEGISGVILFRPMVSPIVYKQQIGRVLTAGNGDKIVTERLEVEEQVCDCRVLFAQLQSSLFSTCDHYFAVASIYYAEHDDLDIPKRYKTPIGLSLGSWINVQRLVRAGKRTGNLTAQRIERLDGIRMQWKSRTEQAFERDYAAAKEYAEKHGNLLVPVQWKCDDSFMLGGWLANWCVAYNNGVLQKNQIRRLNDLEVVWTVFDAKRNRGFASEAGYCAEYGDLLVPPTCADENGFQLGKWLHTQKQLYNTGKLSDDRIAKLEQIGMCWESRSELLRNRAYTTAVRYSEEHENLAVPVAYVPTLTESPWGNGGTNRMQERIWEKVTASCLKSGSRFWMQSNPRGEMPIPGSIAMRWQKNIIKPMDIFRPLQNMLQKMIFGWDTGCMSSDAFCGKIPQN